MPRPRRGLGQGLDALVRDSHQDFTRFSQPEPPASPDSQVADQPAELLRWEYACVERPRKGKRTSVRVWFSSSGAAAILKPRPLVLATRSAWPVLGLLGEEGWELVGVEGRRFYFKRPLREARD